jgi:hypothetical protein
MRLGSTGHPVQQRQRAVAAFHAYLVWMDERDAVRDTYERWASGCPGGGPLAFGAYRAALDREEHASYVYETIVRQIPTGASASAQVARPHASTQEGRIDDTRDARPNAA